MPRRAVSLRVLFQMATVGAFTALVKVAGGAKIIFTARAFGVSDALDAYLIAFLLPSFVCDTLAGSLNSALVPTYIQLREREGQAAAHRLYRTVLAAGSLVLLADRRFAGCWRRGSCGFWRRASVRQSSRSRAHCFG